MAQVPVAAELVVTASGQRFPVTGRCAAVLAILAANADRVNGFDFGKLTIDCTPNKAHVSLSESVGVAKIADADLTAPRARAPPPSAR